MAHELKAYGITLKKPNLPVVLNNKIIIKKDLLSFKGKLKVVKPVRTQEDVLYESKLGDFLSGDAREITIVNRLNMKDNSSRTIAKCKSHSGEVYEKTSDNITKLIGQNNYDTLFSALCSVINQELRIRGIYSLLTCPKSTTSSATQADELKLLNSPSESSSKFKMEVQCQTDESYLVLHKSSNQVDTKRSTRRRMKRCQLAPYVIQDVPVEKKPRKLVIPPCNFSTILKSVGPDVKEESQKDDLPDLGNGTIIDNDCNNSNHSTGNFSALSFKSTPELYHNPLSMIMANVNKRIKDCSEKGTYTLNNLDSGKITDISKPSEEPSKNIPPQHHINEVLQQGINDYHNCLRRDESGHLPIHEAVLNNDLALLKRQCIVLKMRGVTVDVQADNMTPLKMSLYQDNVEMTFVLLQYNADVLDSDAQDRTIFHIAAEMATDHLQVLINHCRLNARKILEENTALWKDEYEKYTDKELAKILLKHINGIANDQGYTPLMLAATLGVYENVKLLIETAPDMVNAKMPSSGNTALYLAVGAACMDCTKRGNKSKVIDRFRKTIEILVENGADPNLKNFAGTNINDLLSEYNIGDLSMLVANKLTCRNFGHINDNALPPGSKPYDSFMLIKDEDGNVDIKKLEKEKKNKQPKNSKITKKNSSQSVAYTPPLKSKKKPIIIKTETISPDYLSQNASNTNNDNNIRTDIPLVQHFKLNQPLILKTVRNKTKLKICVEQTKSNSND